MNPIKTILALVAIGLLTVSGCKKDKDQLIVYPIRLDYKYVDNDSEIKAYEVVNWELVPINAAPYAADVDFDRSNIYIHSHLVLLSDTSAKIHYNDTTRTTVTYTVTADQYRFEDDSISHTLRGDNSTLTWQGVIIKTIYSNYTGYDYVSGLCVEGDGLVSLPCGSIESYLDDVEFGLSEGDIVVLRTFDYVYK